MGGMCGTYGESRGAYRVLVERSEGKTPLGRPRCRWEDNTKMYVQEVKWGHGLDYSGSGYGQVAEE
jgi:hypothetical protein